MKQGIIDIEAHIKDPYAHHVKTTGWNKIADPPTGWLATQVAGWTADQFTPGGMEVDFSALVPAGTKAVRVMVSKFASIGVVYYRKSGDTNISNTPHASLEYSHRILMTADYANLVELWLSSDYKVQFAVTSINIDLYIPYPSEYMV